MKKILLSIYEIFIALPILVVLTLLTSIITIIGSAIGKSDFWGYYPARIWSRLFCFFSLVKVEVSGRENMDKNKSYVFVSNHQGAYDIFLVYGYLNHNFKWVMKQSLRNIPFVGKACQSAGHIFIDRGNPTAIQHTIEAAKMKLQGGMSVVIFPEGTRSEDGKLHKFKRGAYQIAVDLNIPVVPMTINGSFEIFPRTGKLLSRHPLTLTIHKPIYPIGKKGTENLEMLMEESYKSIASGLDEKYK